MSVTTLLLLILGILAEVESLPDGAPKSACTTGQPGHGTIPAQTGQSTHAVVALKSTYEASEAIIGNGIRNVCLSF